MNFLICLCWVHCNWIRIMASCSGWQPTYLYRVYENCMSVYSLVFYLSESTYSCWVYDNCLSILAGVSLYLSMSSCTYSCWVYDNCMSTLAGVSLYLSLTCFSRSLTYFWFPSSRISRSLAPGPCPVPLTRAMFWATVWL